MKNFPKLLIVLLAVTALASCADKKPATLAEAFKGKFTIGATLNKGVYSGTDTAAANLVIRQFSSITAENCMKQENIQPEKGKFYWDEAEAFVSFGEKYDKEIIGHNLVWHSQMARWFAFEDGAKFEFIPGQRPVFPPYCSKEEFLERMHDHITTLVSHFKGRVDVWEVCNEILEDDGTFRKSPYYNILGEEFVYLAFQWAHEADPDARLYLNDYNMHIPAKVDTYVRLVKELQSRGLRVDAVGMQEHLDINNPTVEEFETSLNKIAATGVKVYITEWDMSALPNPYLMSAEITNRFEYTPETDPYKEGLSAEQSKLWNNRVQSFVECYLKHADVIDRWTQWGTTDATSWKNGFPIHGRTDYPLLFDRACQPKPVVNWIIANAQKF